MADKAHETLASFPVAALMAVPAAVTKEVLAFGARRMKANAEHLEHILAARSPTDYVDAQMKFAAETMADYADEANRLQNAARAAIDKAA